MQSQPHGKDESVPGCSEEMRQGTDDRDVPDTVAQCAAEFVKKCTQEE